MMLHVWRELNMSHKTLLLIDLLIIAASPFAIWGLLASLGQAWNTNLRGVLPWLRVLRWVTWGSAMLLFLVALTTNGRLWLRNQSAARWGWKLAIVCRSRCAGSAMPAHGSCRNSWTAIAERRARGVHCRTANSATLCCSLPGPRNQRLEGAVQDGYSASDPQAKRERKVV